MHKEYQNAASVLSSCNELIDSYSGPKTTQLKAFYLTIQVTHLLTAGQVEYTGALPASKLSNLSECGEHALAITLTHMNILQHRQTVLLSLLLTQ